MKRNTPFDPARVVAVRIPRDLCEKLTAESLARPDCHHGLIVINHLRRSVEQGTPGTAARPARRAMKGGQR